VIVDLHSHYPMHLVPEGHDDVLDLVRSQKGRWRLLDSIRGALVGLASRFANYRTFDSGPRVTLPQLDDGGVGVALSVLYSPFDEMDLGKAYPAPPDTGYFQSLLRQIDLVETEVATHPGQARVAHNPAELEEAISAGEIALVHCVEGGFHFGGTPADIDANVTELARRGAAYVTLAHLFWRKVATNANAIPFLPDPLYNFLFPQPDDGLSELGRALITAMVREGILVDVSHMSPRSLTQALDLLDELDPDKAIPVIASHSAYRSGRQEYNLDAIGVERIAARNGVIGLIMAAHQANDGIHMSRPRGFDQSFDVLAHHIDHIAAITGSHRHVGIGTDLDGFIKPTLSEIETATDLVRVEDALLDRYGADDGELIASGNALRVLRTGWRGAPAA
jgi:microsomal dipeptidase-like Zn-dependent dipeptidase